MVEVTTRTIQSRLLLRPSPKLNDIVLGIVGRALSLYDVELHAFAVLSNHAHWLVTPADAQELARFMGYVNGNLSKEIGRLHDWQGSLWQRRYRAICITDEDAQVARLRYILSQGCKENLVATPAEWPGATSVHALVTGTALTGTWVDRAARYEANRRRLEFDERAFEVRYPVTLAPLPCWRGLSEDQHRQRCGELVADIERETADRHAREGTRPLGAAHVLAQHPHDQPAQTNKSPAPLVHASTKQYREMFIAAYRRFEEAFRTAAERLKQGLRNVTFPLYSFPPGAPFVRGVQSAVMLT